MGKLGGWLVFLKGVLPYSWGVCFVRSLNRPFEPQSLLFQNRTLTSQTIAFTREVIFALPTLPLALLKAYYWSARGISIPREQI